MWLASTASAVDGRTMRVLKAVGLIPTFRVARGVSLTAPRLVQWEIHKVVPPT